MRLDPQVTIGLVGFALAIGWVAQVHGLLPWIRSQINRRSAWKPRIGVLGAPDKACNRDVPQQ